MAENIKMQTKVDKMLFLCPKCMGELAEQDGRAVCKQGHSYDRCRAGYYNLLLSNKSSVHGDNKAMVAARRDFLGRDFYRPLADAIADALLTRALPLPRVLDAGAGEGYYTDIVERALRARDGSSRVSAFDISKDAVREAAKKNPNVSFAVAGSYAMPIASGSVDALINIFSPLALSETQRVLRSGGLFVMAIPDTDHLFELKSAIYDTPYKNTVSDTTLDGFSLVSDRELKYNMPLERDALLSLFAMTPYAYRTSPENAARVYALPRLDTTAHFRVLVYEKC